MSRKLVFTIIAFLLPIISFLKVCYGLNPYEQSIRNTIWLSIFLGSCFAWVENLTKRWFKEEIEADNFLIVIFCLASLLVLFGSFPLLFADWFNKFEWFKINIGEIKISPEAFLTFTMTLWITNLGIDCWDKINQPKNT